MIMKFLTIICSIICKWKFFSKSAKGRCRKVGLKMLKKIWRSDQILVFRSSVYKNVFHFFSYFDNPRKFTFGLHLIFVINCWFCLVIHNFTRKFYELLTRKQNLISLMNTASTRGNANEPVMMTVKTFLGTQSNSSRLKLTPA